MILDAGAVSTPRAMSTAKGRAGRTSGGHVVGGRRRPASPAAPRPRRRQWPAVGLVVGCEPKPRSSTPARRRARPRRRLAARVPTIVRVQWPGGRVGLDEVGDRRLRAIADDDHGDNRHRRHAPASSRPLGSHRRGLVLEHEAHQVGPGGDRRGDILRAGQPADLDPDAHRRGTPAISGTRPGRASARCQPAPRRRRRRGRPRRPARLSMPDSAIRTAVRRQQAISWRWRSVSISIVCRSRALTSDRRGLRPTRAPLEASCTSTSVSIPSSSARSIRSARLGVADHGQDHQDRVGAGHPLGGDLLGEDVKSLASAGSGELARASVRCSRLPPKSRGGAQHRHRRGADLA